MPRLGLPQKRGKKILGVRAARRIREGNSEPIRWPSSRLVGAQPIALLPVSNTLERELPGNCFGGFPLQHDAKWITGTSRLIT